MGINSWGGGDPESLKCIPQKNEAIGIPKLVDTGYGS